MWLNKFPRVIKKGQFQIISWQSTDKAIHSLPKNKLTHQSHWFVKFTTNDIVYKVLFSQQKINQCQSKTNLNFHYSFAYKNFVPKKETRKKVFFPSSLFKEPKNSKFKQKLVDFGLGKTNFRIYLFSSQVLPQNLIFTLFYA